MNKQGKEYDTPIIKNHNDMINMHFNKKRHSIDFLCHKNGTKQKHIKQNLANTSNKTHYETERRLMISTDLNDTTE